MAATPTRTDLEEAHTVPADEVQGDPFRKPRRGQPPWALVLLAVVALALGAAVAVLWMERQELKGSLAAAGDELATLKTEREASQAEAREAQQQVSALQKELSDARTALGATEQELDMLEQEAADADAQVRELEAMAKRFKRMIDSGKLSVSLRRGRMVVDLPAKVLFPSGKAELSEEGQQSLREVARILRSVRGKRFIVAGHTDNQKLTKKAPFDTNWELSAARAVVVTEAMVRYGLRPGNLVAAGYGPHDPVASNRSARGRQQNRRIEIILEPQVRALPPGASGGR